MSWQHIQAQPQSGAHEHRGLSSGVFLHSQGSVLNDYMLSYKLQNMSPGKCVETNGETRAEL